MTRRWESHFEPLMSLAQRLPSVPLTCLRTETHFEEKMANLFFDFPCTASCSDKVSASQAKGKSADPAEAPESFESVVKKLLANDDPNAQADASAVASAVAAGNVAAAGTELVVTQAADTDGETLGWQDTQWASTGLAIGTGQQVLVDAVNDTSSQSDALAMPIDPSLSRQLGQPDGSSQADLGDAALVDIGDVPSADANAELETLADGASVDGVESLDDDADLPSETLRDATASDSAGNAEALSAAAGTALDTSGNTNSGQSNEQPQTLDEFASTKTDRGNAEPAVSPLGGELVEDAPAEKGIAEKGTGESLEERLESERLVDAAVPISGASAGSRGRSVTGGDAADAGGISESSGSLAGAVSTEQAVASSEASNSSSRVADRFDNEITSDGWGRANDADSAVDDAATADLAGQDALQQLASGSAGEAVHEDASAMGAIQPVSQASAEDFESLDLEDSGDLSVDPEVLESASLETGSQADLGGQASQGGDLFDAIVSGEPTDVIPETSEQPSVVPIDSPFDASQMSVDQEIIETLSLEEFISQSTASPEAVKKTAEVINDAMRSSLQLEGQTVRVEIHPAELGTLKIQVTQSDQAIETQIIATEFVTSELLTSHRDQLMEALSDLGFETSDVNISYEDQSSTESESRQTPAEHRYQSKPETQSQVSRASVSGGGVNIVA